MTELALYILAGQALNALLPTDEDGAMSELEQMTENPKTVAVVLHVAGLILWPLAVSYWAICRVNGDYWTK